MVKPLAFVAPFLIISSAVSADVVDERIDFLSERGFVYFFVDREADTTEIVALSERGEKVEVLLNNDSGRLLRHIYEPADEKDIKTLIAELNASSPQAKGGRFAFDFTTLFNDDDDHDDRNGDDRDDDDRDDDDRDDDDRDDDGRDDDDRDDDDRNGDDHDDDDHDDDDHDDDDRDDDDRDDDDHDDDGRDDDDHDDDDRDDDDRD